MSPCVVAVPLVLALAVLVLLDLVLIERRRRVLLEDALRAAERRADNLRDVYRILRADNAASLRKVSSLSIACRERARERDMWAAKCEGLRGQPTGYEVPFDKRRFSMQVEGRSSGDTLGDGCWFIMLGRFEPLGVSVSLEDLALGCDGTYRYVRLGTRCIITRVI